MRGWLYMGYITEESAKLIFQNDGEKLQIEAWGKNSLRVRSILMGNIEEKNSVLIGAETANPFITIENQKGIIQNGKIKAVIDDTGWRPRGKITFYNEKNEVLLSEITNGGSLNLHARKFTAITGGDYRLKVTFESNASEKIYGMGQYQQEIFNLKGCNLELAHRNSQASIPFYLSDLGYGFFWNNPAIGNVHFGTNTTEWYAESTKQLDYWITAGDTPSEIEESYANVTGKVPMMPEYGLGLWQSKLRYSNQEELLSVAREYKRRNIPIDVIVIDFFHWPKMGDFKFNEEFFPEPKLMVTELKEMGIELMVSVWPQIGVESENFSEMKEKGYLVRTESGVNVQMQFGGDSVFFDATNSDARKFVWKKCKQNYSDYGIKIFWLDEAEPEYGSYDFGNYRYHSGSVLQTGNMYPREFSRTFYEGQSANGQEEIVNLVRCAWAGSQKYGALVWSGDIGTSYEYLRNQICAGLQMGIAGIPWWTTDIGGFGGGNPDDPKFRELFIRWFQFGTFCPVMRLHGDRLPTKELYSENGTREMHTGGGNEVWSYGEEVYPILVKFIEIRELMREYTRHLMEEAHEKGTPIIRPLFYEFPLDKRAWDLFTQYMYGEDILVAPIIEENAVSRDVYLPAGVNWTLASSGILYEGGQSYRIEAPLDTLPIFLKENKQEYLIGKV